MGYISRKPTGRALEVVTVIMCGSSQLLFGYDRTFDLLRRGDFVLGVSLTRSSSPKRQRES